MMKRVFVLISLVVAVLVIGGNAFAQDKTSKSSIPEPSLSSEWKFVNMYFNGTTFYVDTKRITHLPGGIVKVWSLKVPRGETRRRQVNGLKRIFLFEGKNPNIAERLWYEIALEKFNCETHQYAVLEPFYYSFGKIVLFSHSFQHELKWENIPPGSVDEVIEKYVCNKAPLSIPDPSLGPEWKPLGMNFDLSTSYFNTRKITYLPGHIVKVWALFVPRGEERKRIVNVIKENFLSKGKDPNNAKRLWYYIELIKLNCKKHQSALLETTAYSFGRAVLDDEVVQHEEWKDIPPGSADEEIKKYLCK